MAARVLVVARELQALGYRTDDVDDVALSLLVVTPYVYEGACALILGKWTRGQLQEAVWWATTIWRMNIRDGAEHN